MFALVANGVHDLQPEATNKTGQLYVIHGVLANSMDIPLLSAITARKNAQTYEVLYGKMKEWTSNAGGYMDIRIVLDLEKAAINAAKKEHGAYDKCSTFLGYLHENWYTGLFENMWQKWDVTEFRTSNAAESFNWKLGVIIGVKYPRMADFIKTLQGCVITARVLINFVKTTTKKIRKEGQKTSRTHRKGNVALQISVKPGQSFFSNSTHHFVLP
ncbi:hypothetical protein GCK32_014002 [Trichostrongylus colubriformis]|uniref:MULE transposase domain-containing protein n=1 Tax=Trichostrongylus colubriformis TaxID=6319 RepID=A0AAN8FQL2_TRICO